MAEIFHALPGVELPVREVTDRLASMWETDSVDSPLAFRASQMNVILHFGLEVTSENARERFDALVRFAQRYPSRIIVLCPTCADLENTMESKLFSQCYIGESSREMCCCEALMLRYEPENSEHLSNQVSIWLEGDLPTYYWFSEVAAQRIKKYFDNLLPGVRRYVYDSSIESSSVLELNWPDSWRVSDLAEARLLSVRQTIGQFLNRYSIERICEGLQTVRVHHSAETYGEGHCLLKWVRSCLDECVDSGACDIEKLKFSLSELGVSDPCLLKLEFTYNNAARYFVFCQFKLGLHGEIKADLGKGEEKIPVQIKPLPMEYALAESFFA